MNLRPVLCFLLKHKLDGQWWTTPNHFFLNGWVWSHNNFPEMRSHSSLEYKGLKFIFTSTKCSTCRASSTSIFVMIQFFHLYYKVYHL